MESSHQSIRFDPWYTALFFQPGFSQTRNEDGVLVLGIYKPLGTRFHRRLICGMLSMNPDQTWEKPFCYQHVSFFRDGQSARICLFFGSAATHSHKYSEPIFNKVSSTMYSEVFSLFDDIIWGLCFWIHFQIATWLLSTLCKKNIALATPLVDKSRKYKYKALPISDEGVLFLVLPTHEIGHLRAIGLSLS